MGGGAAATQDAGGRATEAGRLWGGEGWHPYSLPPLPFHAQAHGTHHFPFHASKSAPSPPIPHKTNVIILNFQAEGEGGGNQASMRPGHTGSHSQQTTVPRSNLDLSQVLPWTWRERAGSQFLREKQNSFKKKNSEGQLHH